MKIGIGTLALVADLGIERLAPTVRVPALRSSRTLTRLALAGACAACVALKFLLHVHFSLFGFGFWAGAVLTAALVVLASRAREAKVAVGTTRTAPSAPTAPPIAPTEESGVPTSQAPPSQPPPSAPGAGTV